MPAEIVPAWFCADYWSEFEVIGSTGDKYIVHWYGAESQPSCFNVTKQEFCKGMQYTGECRHVTATFRKGCFWNPQWYEGGTRELKPVSKPPDAHRNARKKLWCPKCHGPVVGVRIAV